MGNCTSKKSGKLSKFSLSKLPSGNKMDKEQSVNKVESRGLSTKIAPTSKGQTTSFGFKRSTRSASALPTPVTLTSRVAEMRQDAQSGSSVESLCHVASTSSPLVTQKATPSPTSAGHNRRSPSGSSVGGPNRFGFRSGTPTRLARQSPGPNGGGTPGRSPSARSKSAGPREAREAFFKESMQPAGSANSVLGSQANLGGYPGKFWLQTSQLPRPQFPVRLSDKTYKTVTNYCRRDGPVESGSSKEESVTEDSGIGSQQHSNTLGETDTLHGLELSDSSPAPPIRGRTARKLELRMVNTNKFELLDQNQPQGPATFVKAPRTTLCTGLVQQRTEQYLQRIAGVKDSNRLRPNGVQSPLTSPGEGTESEEEKLKKDANRSEKNSGISYLMTEGVGESDELLPGEAMAEDITLSFSSDEDVSSVGKFEMPAEPKKRPLVAATNVNGVAIRTDALRLSNQLKSAIPASFAKTQVDDSCFGLLNAEERSALDEDTLLEFSSESDSLGDKDRGMEKITEPINTSTDSPGTPSNGSMSEGRDFLIDDEIADQPQLCFSTHEDVAVEKAVTASGNNNGSEGTTLGPINGFGEGNDREGKVVRRASVGTLSPCESLMSDDLIMDFDSAGDDNGERCPGTGGNEDNLSLDGMELSTKHDDLLKQWASLPRMRHIGASLNGTNGKLGVGSSGGSSPASHRSGVSRASTEEDLSVRLDKSTYQHMFQDIVSIKSMLLKLNRILSESDGSLGPYTEEEQAMDLKKQVAFLQQQLQQRENSLQSLECEVNRGVDRRTRTDLPSLCNAATQTDRVRPVSTGPSILQNLPSDTNNVVTNAAPRKVTDWLDDNNRHSLVRVAPADKILEKVKELSFKPVEVLERERAQRHAVSGKNVFKITKIDLVLKSDNYGQSELRKS